MTTELKGSHVLIATLVFFGVAIAVNIAMATYAITTFSGEDIPNPYIRGLAYNRTLAAHAAQNKLGWTAEIGAARMGADTRVTLSVRDHQSRELSTLKVEVTFRRPTNAKLDRTETLAGDGNGLYAASVRGLAPGAWDVIARTTAPDGTVFEATRRVVLK